MTNIDQRFPWSFLGVLISVIFGVFGIYTVFFYSRLPALELEAISQAPVFSVREDVDDLDIIFQGKNIRETDQGLTVITVRVSNQGSAPIRSSDFDQKAPLTLNVENGEIIKSNLSDSSEDYFKTVFSEITIDRSAIKLPPFIMEPGKFMDIQTLILHARSSVPSLTIHGKVADAGTLVIRTNQRENGATSPVSAIDGNFRTQFLRVLVYGLGTTVSIILIVVTMAQMIDRISQWQSKRERRRREENRERRFLSFDSESREILTPFVNLLRNRHVPEAVFVADHVLQSANSMPSRYSDEQIDDFFEKIELLSPGITRMKTAVTPKLLQSLRLLMNDAVPLWNNPIRFYGGGPDVYELN